MAVVRCQVMWLICCLVSAQPYLATTLHHICDMLAPHPHILHPVLSALHGDMEAVTTFVLETSTEPTGIRIVQLYWKVPVLPTLFQADRMRRLGLEHYLEE